MAKSLVITYILWFFGGAFGLHHFYLRRDLQCLIWMCLPGGYFGAGWFRDLWRIPDYVREANGDPEYLKKLSEKMRNREKPPFSFVRVLGQLIVGNMFGILFSMSVPEPEDIGVDLLLLADVLAPAGSALGIWMVGNIGKEKGSIMWPLLGCYAMTPFHIYGYTTYMWTTVVGIVAFQMKAKQWRRTISKPGNIIKRAFVLFLCGGIYVGLWSSYLYFNLKIVTKDGDRIKFRDAAKNFLTSPAVQEFTKNSHELWRHLLEHGFWSTVNQLVDSLDPLGEKHALRTLELDKGSTQEDIRARYRDLSKKWHPDKYLDENEKAEAHEKFVEIQQAYERLSQIKRRRKSRNSHSQAEDDERKDF